MKAIISGRLETALVIDGSRLYSVQYSTSGEEVLRTPEELRHLSVGADDLQYVDAENGADVRVRLNRAVRDALALDRTLFLLDAELTTPTRRAASIELDD